MAVLTKGALVPVLLFAAAAWAAEHVETNRSLDCDAVFLPDVSATDLNARFGSENVVAGDIPIGEGDLETGTILYPDSPRDRVEILWKDPEARRSPRTVGLVGNSSNWASKLGVTLGMDLKELERLNGVPFTLAGFAWDYGGTVMSWGGGALEAPFDGCRLVVRLAPELKYIDPEWAGKYEQVMGDRPFRSDDSLMQDLNPKIYAVLLRY